MKVYKVFYQDENNELWSFHKWNYVNHWFTVNYKRGIINYPPEGTGCLFCFKTRENAKNFIKGITVEGDLIILPVEVELAGIQLKEIAMYSTEVKDFWEINYYSLHQGYYNTTNIPYGTICVKSVRILEE
jgi:hypothetical protein